LRGRIEGLETKLQDRYETQQGRTGRIDNAVNYIKHLSDENKVKDDAPLAPKGCFGRC